MRQSTETDLAEPDLIDRLGRGFRAYALVAVIALLAALPGVFRVPPLDRDESRFAQATVQMLETGDFVRIAVQDEPRNKKPIGIHWLQAAAVGLFSSAGARAIWAYRVPSVIGALVAALATLWGGAALVGRRAALIGAALLACCVLLSSEAMIAKTDATLCGATTLAMAALARLRARAGPAARQVAARALGLRTLNEGGDGAALIFWAAVGAGVLVKGPITPMVAGLTLAALAVWERRAEWMKPLWRPAGPILCALIVLPWFIAIAAATQGRFFTEALGGDLGRKLAGGDEGHAGPPGYHLVLLPLLSFPIAVALPCAARTIWRAVRAPPVEEAMAGVRFLVAWAAPTWLVFEMLPTKLIHYPLPAYPALALLAGTGLLAAYEAPWPKTRLAGAGLFLIAAAALTGVCAFLSGLAPGDADATSRRELQTSLVVGFILLAPLAGFVLARRAPLAAGAALAAALCFAFIAREKMLPEARTWLVSREASDALMRVGLHPRQHPHGPRLIAVGYSEPSFVFLTRTDTLLAKGNDAPRAAVVGQAVIVESRERTTLERALAVRDWAFQPIGEETQGFDYSNNRRVALQAGRIIPAAGGMAPPAPPSERRPQ